MALELEDVLGCHHHVGSLVSQEQGVGLERGKALDLLGSPVDRSRGTRAEGC